MPAKTGLDALLRPEDSILVLIDHQPYQFANLKQPRADDDRQQRHWPRRSTIRTTSP
jgi:hypothetical protein